MKIAIITIDPSENRYGTVGDWLWANENNLLVTTTRCGNKDTEFLVGAHEMIEAYLCQRDGIDEEVVSNWDIAHPDAEEPAEVEGSPYMDQHSIATQIELKMCAGLGMDWNNHNRWVQNAGDEVERQLTSGVPVARITKEGSRYWAELHLFALRVSGENYCHEFWLHEWIKSLPFDGCPCEQHLKEFLRNNPPDWSDFFGWSVRLHNTVNDRIGRPVIEVDDARELWSSRSF